MVKPDKSKVISVLLAVFLSFWTWLYTYKFDKYKFWVGLAGTVIGLCFLFIFFIGIIPIGIWIWSIIDTATKDQEWLDKYYTLKVKYV